jgi:hypothetical protein
MDRISKKSEQQWQAESDAHTMAQYQEILSDRNRMNRAIKVAKQQATDLTKRANAMKSVANTKATGGRISRKKK